MILLRKINNFSKFISCNGSKFYLTTDQNINSINVDLTKPVIGRTEGNLYQISLKNKKFF